MNIFTYATQAKALLILCLSFFSFIYSTQATDPIPVCEAHTVVTLDNTGYAYVNAVTFDDGSTDDSGCLDGFKARRMDTPNDPFTEVVVFSCADIGPALMVVMRVYDCDGNYADCMVEVTVLDNTPPAIYCPDGFTVNCDNISEIYNSPPATAIDNCALASLTHNDFSNLNNCGEGEIERTWTATDIYGHSSTCTQIFTLINDEVPTVTFFDPTPPIFQSCGGQSFDEPTVNGNYCTMVGVEHTDEVYTIVPDACFKIVRTWKIMDWCRFELNNPINDPAGVLVQGYEYELGDDGYMEYVQVLKFLDDELPTIELEVDSVYCNFSDDCGPMSISLPVTIADDCTPTDMLTLHHNLYLWEGNEWMEHIIGGDGEFQGDLANGYYKIDYIVNDGCGNFSTEWATFLVKDCKKPTPYCIAPSTVVIQPEAGGAVALWATDFDFGSYDNCTSAGNLTFALISPDGIGEIIPAAIAMDGFQGLSISSCDVYDNNNEPFNIELHVTDEEGNTEYCTFEVSIQDNGIGCEAIPIILQGNINAAYTSMGETNITLTDAYLNQSSTATEDNYYDLFHPYSTEQFPISLTCEYIPSLDLSVIDLEDIDVIANYILLEIPITDKYQRLSADMNKDGNFTGADVVLIRRIILGFDDAVDSLRMHYVVDNNENLILNSEDLSGLYNIDAYLPGDIIVGASPSEIMDTPVLNVSSNDQIVSISVNNSVALDAIQFTLEFDPSMMHTFDLGKDISFEQVNTTNLDEGMISFLGSNLKPGQTIFQFNTTKNNTNDLLNSIKLTSNKTKALAKNQGVLIQPTLNKITTTITRVYPNPFTKVLNLNVESDLLDGATQVRVYNNLGKIVYEHILDTHSISLGEHLPKGVYFVQLLGKNYDETIKVVKQ